MFSRSLRLLKAFLLLVLLELMVAMVPAQSNKSVAFGSQRTVFATYPSALGISMSPVENVSLSWKNLFDRIGVEVGVGGFWDPASTTGPIYWYSVNGALSYRLLAEDFASWIAGGLDLVAFAGYRGEDGYEAVFNEDDYSFTYVRTGYRPYLFFGAGIGIETVLFKHFSQEVQFLYLGQFLHNPGIRFGVNFAYRYRF